MRISTPPSLTMLLLVLSIGCENTNTPPAIGTDPSTPAQADTDTDTDVDADADADVDADTDTDTDTDADADTDTGTDSEPFIPWANEGSPLSTNLSGVVDYADEWAFVDLMKSSREWISATTTIWDDGRNITVDSHGWPTSTEPDQIVRTLMLWEVTHIPEGEYLVLYDGEADLSYGKSAVYDAAQSTPGRHILQVTSSDSNGIILEIRNINEANPIRNIRVLMPGGVCDNSTTQYCEDNSDCGTGTCASFEDVYEEQLFHPKFLTTIKNYHSLRYMDWMQTNSSPLTHWDDRAKPSDVRWSTTSGVPLEIMINLSNRLHADPWFTLPHLATDDFVQQFANTVAAELDATLSVYVEHSNEVWNSQFAQSGYAQQQGAPLSADPFLATLYYHSKRSVEIFTIFESTVGPTHSLVRVMGSQAANSWVSEQLLDYQGASAHTDALAIAPYFGGNLGTPTEAGRVVGLTIDELLDELQTQSVPAALQWVSENEAVSTSRGVDLVAYEGGQHLAGVQGEENNQALTDLFLMANRHPRMGEIYTDYLEGWFANGGGMYYNFTSCDHYSKWGSWGSLEWLEQPRAEAPKYNALQTYIEAH